MAVRQMHLVAAAVAVLTAIGCASQGTKMSDLPQREGFVRTMPEGQEPARLLGKDDAVGMRSGLQVLPLGKDCGWHSTENYEELIICLAGSGELASEDGTRQPLKAGQYAYNPPQTRHNVLNTGTDVLRYVYVVAPAASAAQDHH